MPVSLVVCYQCSLLSFQEYCELCSHHFSFTPIYSPNMPRRLPLKDVVSGLLHSVGAAVVSWMHYTLVAIAWLGVVPLAVCRIYRCFFTVSLDPVSSCQPLMHMNVRNPFISINIYCKSSFEHLIFSS